MTRRFLLALVLLAVPTLAQAQQKEVVRISGEVTAQNYRAFAGFLLDATDRVVGLKVAFPGNEAHATGKMTAMKDGDLFIAYVAGPDSDSQIAAKEGYSFQHGAYVFDGYFVVKYGGMNQGIVGIYLDKADEALVTLSGRPIEDVDIGSLKAPAN